MKKALFIGGTGTISTAITQRIASMPGWELYLINRGNRSRVIPPNVKLILADINDEEDVRLKLEGLQFDCVCDFIGFVPSQVERDYRLFKDITKQYMYISSASAYEKPVSNYIITEETPLVNPYWQYSRDKIACEAFLMEKYKNEGFPVTIIRPTYTYDERSVPLSVMGNSGSWQVLDRMLQGKQVIIKITGTADASPINRPIAYNGQYGEYPSQTVYKNGEPMNLSLTREEGIATNEQLAFARALGVKDWIEKEITDINKMQRDYKYQIEVSSQKGSKYRRINVQYTFVDAF